MTIFAGSRLLRCSLVLFCSAGCEALAQDYDFEEPRPEVIDFDMALRDVGPITARVMVNQDEAHPNKFSFSARLAHGVRPPQKDGALCPRFPELVAVLDGNVVPLSTLGGWTLGNDPTCQVPALVMTAPPSPRATSVLSIGDPTRTISLDLGDRLQLRTAALVAPPSGGYRSGDSMSVRWSHRDDLATLPELSVARAGQSVAIRADSITRDGDTLTFAVPEGLSAGPQVLQILQRDDVTACSGACSIAARRVVEVLFDVRAP